MWCGLLLIVSLVVLSIAGAFFGAQRAKELFNSVPLVVFWVIFAILLIMGVFLFRSLRVKPGLLLIHFGCVFVLAGGIFGSQAGHRLGREFLGIDKFADGAMAIYEGHSENRIFSKDMQHELTKLPFSIYLHDFRMDYYWEHGKLYIDTQSGRGAEMTAVAGEELALDDGLPVIKIVRVFKNFRISIKGDERVISDLPGSGENPALELELTWPDGTTTKRYVFERFAPDDYGKDGLRMIYRLMPRDYFSDLVVRVDGAESIHKTIEVNKPLHYGGYYFYQHSYDSQQGAYTVLSVTSDRGWKLVSVGYLLLCVGVFWQLWFKKIRKLQSNKVTERIWK